VRVRPGGQFPQVAEELTLAKEDQGGFCVWDQPDKVVGKETYWANRQDQFT